MGYKEENIFKYIWSGDVERVIGYLGVNGGLSFKELQKESAEIESQSWLDDESIFEDEFGSKFANEILSSFGDYDKFIVDQEPSFPESSAQLYVPEFSESSAQLYHLNYSDYDNIPFELLPDDMTRREAADIMLKGEPSEPSGGSKNSTLSTFTPSFRPIWDYFNAHSSSFMRKIGKLLKTAGPIQTILILALLINIISTGGSGEYHWVGVMVFLIQSVMNTMVTISKPLIGALNLLLKYVVGPVGGLAAQSMATTASDTFLGLVGIVKHQTMSPMGRGLLQTLGSYFVSAVFITLLLHLTHYFRVKKRKREMKKFGMKIVNNYNYNY